MSDFARLRRSEDIRAVFAARGACHTASMSVHARPRDAGGPPRAAVVAGRKLGGAVARNRAKRRLRAALSETSLDAAVDVVVVARPPVLRMGYADLRAQLARALAGVAPSEATSR